jgi:NAD(P)-dependent dehydrogenase (short-subunit alcohol dehydrogenase family)
VSSVQELDLEDVKTMMDTNVVSVAALVRAFTPGMVSRNSGHLVFMSSVAGHEAYSGGAAYCATKHALDAFATSGEGLRLFRPVGGCCGLMGIVEQRGPAAALVLLPNLTSLLRA